ncbi:hypothetical protein AU210_016588 [Fusarium oxysporum f. sp. radicis-cucumerinum]|uniref:Nephrocystin 3-like N-terminal domain-containing protein n=1 Tax=Fusarium oxysporum f. sp. radicis-cucumerinum TaxID=327505 RepID=A0A2H3G9T1_FUSOX|nr:hypothetical protein AU210_016588 [Fusarium oxysporum f. sp. radicis-cucumerinum]
MSAGSVYADTVQNQVFRDQHVHGNQIFNTPSDTPQSLVQDCLRSLAYPTMNDRSNAVGIPTGGTCKWLFGHKQWKSWISSHRALLWIKGKPGSGKSTLLHYALREVRSSKVAKNVLILSFFFHGRGSGLQKSLLGLFRSLLYQILSEMPEALTGLVKTYQQRRDGIGKPGVAWKWELDELQNVFKCSIDEALKSRPVWVFVDALDESGAENAKLVIRHFKDVLQGPSSRSQLHICFSCRHYPVQDWESGFEVHTEQENRQDIVTYTRTQLSGYKNPALSPLPDIIAQSSKGLFIWARLVVNQILDLDLEGNPNSAMEMISKSMDRLPQDLDAMYGRIFQIVTKTPASIKLMRLISCTERPLHLHELRWAMVIDADLPHESLENFKKSSEYTEDDNLMERRVKTLSNGLVEVISSSAARTVQFIHQSVKDFFITQFSETVRNSSGLNTTNMEAGHHHIYRICMKYMLMEEWEQLPEPCLHPDSDFPSSRSDKLVSEFLLFNYVSTYWMTHLDKSLPLFTKRSDWPSDTFLENWTKACCVVLGNSRERPPLQIKLAHVLARHGLVISLQRFLEQGDTTSVNAKDVYGRTPLLYAAERGHAAAVQILLDGRANADIQDLAGATPLHWSVLRGHINIMTLLLERGASPFIHDNGGCTALDWAIEGAQRTSAVCVEKLLEWVPNLNYEYALLWAFSKDINEEVVMYPIAFYEYFGVDSGSKLLGMPPTDMDELFSSPDGMPRPPKTAWMPQEHPCYIWTSRKHSSTWIEAINVILRDGDYPMMGSGTTRKGRAYAARTPLLRAVELRNLTLTKMLLAKGADPTFECSNGWSPIRLAKTRGYSLDKEFLELLHIY